MSDRKRILLVEDNPHDIEMTLDALAENHLSNEVVVVNDGEEALDYLHQRGKFKLRCEGDPVVVLLDIKLPKVDGIEVLREIRSTPSLRLQPVVMLTSSNEDRDLLQTYDLGANAYVVKPVDFSAFVKAVSGLGLFWAVVNQPPPMGPPASGGGA